jgi:hypothetical protein
MGTAPLFPVVRKKEEKEEEGGWEERRLATRLLLILLWSGRHGWVEGRREGGREERGGFKCVREVEIVSVSR